MDKIFILLLIFIAFSCQKESNKKELTQVKTPTPVILADEGSVFIDSLLLEPFQSEMLKELYRTSAFKSIWQSKKNRTNILKQFLNSKDEGLNPENYNANQLLKLEKKYDELNDTEKAKYDILLTYSLQKYISHFTKGQINPNNLYNNCDLTINSIDINENLALMVKSDSLAYKMEQLKPNHIVYKSLKNALRIINTFPNDDFRTIELAGKIVLNDSSPSIVDIKKRLLYWKDLKPQNNLSDIYDSETNEAMKKFQMRHGLAADGVIGKGTIEALNFSKQKRKQQIIANLERWRWFPKEMGDEYLIVNIPDYKLILVKGNDTMRTHKVIVGKDKRPTPVLSSRLSNVILNPTWTVPPTILKEDMIPSIARNRNYLAKNNIKVFDSNGNEVSANNWNLSNAKSYRYVQTPGTFNSLGMVKFSFPNRFSVYLHDTNHRDFFEKQKRSLSSGCVRVQNPLELAEYLLGNKTDWNIEKITEILQSKNTKNVTIKNEVGVHILYWTAWSEKNTLIFRDDIYNLDAELYQKLSR
jgi:murein L,D-transpeptidase YcbB/YkuD